MKKLAITLSGVILILLTGCSATSPETSSAPTPVSICETYSTHIGIVEGRAAVSTETYISEDPLTANLDADLKELGIVYVGSRPGEKVDYADLSEKYLQTFGKCYSDRAVTLMRNWLAWYQR